MLLCEFLDYPKACNESVTHIQTHCVLIIKSVKSQVWHKYKLHICSCRSCFFNTFWWCLKLSLFSFPKPSTQIELPCPKFLGIVINRFCFLCPLASSSSLLLCSALSSLLLVFLTSPWQHQQRKTHTFFPPAVRWHGHVENTNLHWQWISNADAATRTSFLQIFSTSNLITLKGAATQRWTEHLQAGKQKQLDSITSLVDWFDEWTDCGHYPQRCNTHLLSYRL